MVRIYKTKIIPVKCNTIDYQYLMDCNKKSAYVWNLCLDLDRDNRLSTGKFLTRSELQSKTKGCIDLHAKGIQHVVLKYVAARDAVSVAIKNGRRDMNYPRSQKNFFVTGWDSQSIQMDSNKSTIKLSRPNKEGKRQRPITCRAKDIPRQVVEIELIYRDRIYLAIKYFEDNSLDSKISSLNAASIDLGEIHSITSIDSNANAIIITGRKLRSIKQLRNKKQSDIRRRMSKCRKGSKQYWKYRKAMQRLSAKFDRKINDCVHKISKLYLDYCIENQISTVYYGDLDGVTRGTKQKGRGSSYLRQKLGQWNFGQITKQLISKLSRYEITCLEVKEYYTSSKCPSCQSINKPLGRNYECSCGYKQHRDIVGSINILNDNSKTQLMRYKTKKYLRIA